MKTLITALLISTISSASLAQQMMKPLVCDTIPNISRVLVEYDEKAIVGGKTLSVSTVDPYARIVTLVGVYVNVEEDTFTIIEWIPEYDIACLLANGKELNFNGASMDPKRPGIEN